MDQDDLVCSEQTLADGQGADLVIGDDATGVPDDVRLALAEPEDCVHSPPLTTMQRYEVTDGGLLRVTVQDRSW